MEREDKIAGIVLTIVIGVVSFALLYFVKYIGISVFGWFESTDQGVGFKDAFPTAIGLSVLITLVFAFFAGDGLLGELPTVIAGFFIFVLFFTFSIAWLY
jgi:hypothetical protein